MSHREPTSVPPAATESIETVPGESDSHALRVRDPSGPRVLAKLGLAAAPYVGRRAVSLCLFFVASRIIILHFMVGYGTDLGTQKNFVAKIVAGQVPFREFAPEYPPLVFLYTGIPAIFDPSLDSYFQVFRVLTCAVDFGIWVILLRFQFSVFGFQRRTPSPPFGRFTAGWPSCAPPIASREREG